MRQVIIDWGRTQYRNVGGKRYQLVTSDENNVVLENDFFNASDSEVRSRNIRIECQQTGDILFDPLTSNSNGAMQPQPGDVVVVWFSCGAASAVAAKKTLERYGDSCTVRVVNNPVTEEDPDNRRFLRDIEGWIGQGIEISINPEWPDCSADEVWRKRKFMSGIYGAPCTGELKKKARQYWESQNHHDWMVMGFTAHEQNRHDDFVLYERVNLLPVLIDAGLSKADCWNILIDAGIELPQPYLKGMPNANCLGCVKATSPSYWNLVRREYPKAFEARAKLSREPGVRLVRYQGDRIFLDELPPDAQGAPLKNLDFECGNFCEERQGSLFYGTGVA